MSIENGSYYGMNPTGNYIWNLLEQEKSIADLLENIAKTFTLSQEQCENEVLPFIQKMIDEKILLIKAWFFCKILIFNFQHALLPLSLLY